MGVAFFIEAVKRFFYLIVLITIGSCSNPNNYYPRLVINAKVLRSLDTLASFDTLKHKGYDLQLSIANNSDKPVTFWAMTCSWNENFMVNNDYIRILPWACESNFPKLFQVNPHDSLVHELTVINIGLTRYSNISTTRLGFIFIDSSVCHCVEDFKAIIGDKSRRQVIWSNELKVNI